MILHKSTLDSDEIFIAQKCHRLSYKNWYDKKVFASLAF